MNGLSNKLTCHQRVIHKKSDVPKTNDLLGEIFRAPPFFTDR